MEEIAPRIVPWARRHGRKGLPWQQNRDPYRVWVSEIMLQQTRVETVIPYYQKFIDRFPNVCTLGSADQDQVLAHWSGLGYYARARNLHRAARQVCVQYDGVVPTSRDALEHLAGIGRSTAAAILSLAYEIPEAILDGNVKRVLCRYHGVKGWPGKSNVQRQLWSHADRKSVV